MSNEQDQRKVSAAIDYYEREGARVDERIGRLQAKREQQVDDVAATDAAIAELEAEREQFANDAEQARTDLGMLIEPSLAEQPQNVAPAGGAAENATIVVENGPEQ